MKTKSSLIRAEIPALAGKPLQELKALLRSSKIPSKEGQPNIEFMPHLNVLTELLVQKSHSKKILFRVSKGMQSNAVVSLLHLRNLLIFCNKDSGGNPGRQ